MPVLTETVTTVTTGPGPSELQCNDCLIRIIIYKCSDIDIYAMKVFWKTVHFLLYMYYMHPSYRTSIFGKKLCILYSSTSTR